MVKLTDGVRFEPVDPVPEVSIEDGEAVLGEDPRVADVHLQQDGWV